MLGAIVRPAIAGVGMFASVAAARACGTGHGPAGLIILVLVGAISYMALSLMTNRSGLREARSLVRRRAAHPISSDGPDSTR
jgi:hypothetical protein